MTYFIHGLIVGFALCFVAFCVLGALLLAHRAPPVTLQRRKYRDALSRTLREPPSMPECEPAREEGVIYRFMGATGEEV
ncbi:hypothetical protein QF001_000909 [Paraburkholderia youngii]|uniref:hypothetical protein n=1 Tax=Paraburkholderia youngii TaxID=2782701 RepID=UPI003D21AB13